MKILAFDTSSSACSVAIQHGNEIKSIHKIAPMQQAKLILPMIQELLDSASLSLNQLDAIAYGCGPGSFTGIRIASSVAQGIGFAAKLPIIPVSSLAVMAQTAFIEQQKAKWLVVLDARMGQIYWAAYQANQDGCVELIGQEEAGTTDGVKIPDAVLNDDDWYGIGDGWEKYEKSLVMRLQFQPQAIYPSLLPNASPMLKLAKVKFEQGRWITANQAVPDYLR